MNYLYIISISAVFATVVTASVYIVCICVSCANMVHCFNNECMNDWVQTFDKGNYCIDCFYKHRYKILKE